MDNNKLRLQVDMFVLQIVTTLQREKQFASVEDLITYLSQETAQLLEATEDEAVRIERLTKLGTPIVDDDLEVGDMGERR